MSLGTASIILNTYIFCQLAISKYGDIVGFYIGNEPQVVVSDYNMIKELMKRDDTASRPSLVPFQDLRPGGVVQGVLDGENSAAVPGIMFSCGKTWLDQRRFTVKVLRDFGFGKSSMEDTLLDEIDKLCEELKRSIGVPIRLSTKLNISVLNALWSMITGEKLLLGDPKLQMIVQKINVFLNSANPSSAIASMFPNPNMFRWSIMKPLRHALGFDIDSLKAGIDGVLELVYDQIERHKANFDEDNITDFVDTYLAEMVKRKENQESSFNKIRGNFYLANVMVDLFIAGMETTASTLNWSFLLLLHHPEIRRNVQKEIDQVRFCFT